MGRVGKRRETNATVGAAWPASLVQAVGASRPRKPPASRPPFSDLSPPRPCPQATSQSASTEKKLEFALNSRQNNICYFKSAQADRARLSHLGWRSQGRGTEAQGGARWCPPHAARVARRAESVAGPRCGFRPGVPNLRTERDGRHAGCVRRREGALRVSARALLGAGQSPAPDRRGGGTSALFRAGCRGHHSDRAKGEPSRRAGWVGVRGSLSRACAANAARGAERASPMCS